MESAAAGHPLPIAPPPSSEAGHSTLRAAQVEHGVSHLVRVRARARVRVRCRARRLAPGEG
eukprot:scaffold13451_cov54-Phaeocystis_antarctica.AAC.1